MRKARRILLRSHSTCIPSTTESRITCWYSSSGTKPTDCDSSDQLVLYEWLILVFIVRDIQSVDDAGASTAPDRLEAFPNDFSKLFTARGSYLLAIHGNLVFASTVLAADPASVCVSHSKGVCSLGNVRSLGDSAALGAKATCGLANDQSTSAITDSQATSITTQS
jgi:hypothetical protein